MNKKILAVALAASFTAGTAQALVIDNFNGDTFSASAPLTDVAAGTSSGGFTRTVTATSSGAFTDVSFNAVATPGLYSHSQGAGITGYSQVDFNLGGLDLNNDANAFSLELDSADLDGVFGIIVDGVSVELISDFSFLSVSNGFPAFSEFLFSDFSGVDFNSVNTVSFYIDGTTQPALDMTIDNFGTTCSALTASGNAGSSSSVGDCSPASTIPEPTSIALLGLGLAAFGYGRRKVK